MKRYIGKYLILLGGLLALAPMSGCKLDDPEIPVEELYLRNFIKQYGLIDPTQDFSSAKQVSVTLNLPDEAKVVNIYAKVGDEYYRVGCFAELSGKVTLPVDVSKATETVMVDVDGVRYYTEPNGTVDVKKGEVRSRALPGESDNAALTNLWIDNWTTATANNGETGRTYTNGPRTILGIKDGKLTGDLVDGYIDVRTAAHVGKNLENENITDFTRLGEKASGAGNADLGDWCFNDCEVGNTQKGTNIHFRIKNDDDTLSSYKFTFRTASCNDAQVRAVIIGKSTVDGKTGVDVYMDSKALKVESNYKGSGTGTYNTATNDEYTEWEVRTDLMPKGEYQLIIMGVDASENTVIKRQHCGNWGFMKIERLKTTRDMRWILACEDLGTTDDFDFNDVVFSIEAVNTNSAALNLGVAQWQVVENPNDNGFVLNPTNSTGTQTNAPSRADSDNTNTTLVKVTALAAGGTLPIWLHFREADGKDYIVSPSYGSGNRECMKEATAGQASQELAKENNNEEMYSHCNEWHRWFDITDLKDTEEYYDGKDVAKLSSIMLNTGFNKYSPGRSVTFTTSNVFSLEKFCYIQYGTGGKGPHIPEGTDEWAKKVLEWQWQQENAQEVTFGFFLTVYKPIVGDNDNDGTKAHLISKGLEGLPPQMFLIPDCDALYSTGYLDAGGWKWPCERINITRAYPNFRAWVENKDATAGSNWFMMPAPGIVDKDWLLFPRVNPDKFPYKSQKKDSQSVAEDKTEKI